MHPAPKYLKSAELFNPETGTFEMLSAEPTADRDGPAAALLNNGQVLIVSGYNEVELGAARYLKTAELTSVTAATVTTAAASIVATTTATPNGTVLSEALGSEYFQYGTSTAYGASTPHQSALASLGAVPFAAGVSGLMPATTYHFRLVAENAGGVSYGGDRAFTTSALPPVPPTITGASQSHRRWREGGKLAQISGRKRKKPPVGTTFSFALNEQASISFNFTHKVSGHKIGRKCVAKAGRNGKHKSCKRTVIAGTLTFTGHSGVNKVAFQGRVSPSHKLNPGRYTLVITATNSGGQKSAPKSISFTIVK